MWIRQINHLFLGFYYVKKTLNMLNGETGEWDEDNGGALVNTFRLVRGHEVYFKSNHHGKLPVDLAVQLYKLEENQFEFVVFVFRI